LCLAQQIQIGKLTKAVKDLTKVVHGKRVNLNDDTMEICQVTSVSEYISLHEKLVDQKFHDKLVRHIFFYNSNLCKYHIVVKCRWMLLSY
jgi:hypothetical protein